MIDIIQSKIGNFEILFMFKTGSELFCTNCKDSDVVVVIKDWDKDAKKYFIDGVDYFCYSETAFEKMAKMESGNFDDLFAVELLFATGENLLYGENPISDYNWFDYKYKAVETALKCGERNYFSPNVHNAINAEMCCKRTMWAFIIYFVIVNNAPTLTSEQLVILQKCHDNELPRSIGEMLQADLQELAVQND